MLLTIHDASLRKVAFIDNDKQATLNYFNDAWTRYLETGSSTFDFTVFKKSIISDVGRKRAYNYLNEKAFVSFQYKGKTYLHTIRKVEENEQVIKCYGINLNLELINEYANPYKAPKAMTFKEYCDAMDLLNFTFLKNGVNEISTKKISAEWDGTDTKLNRLLSLATKFGAEIEFDTHLNADSSIKSFVVNVYHENDDNHQGVGRVSPTILKYGKNLKALTRTVDKTNIYNMIRPTGKDEQGNTITISGLGTWSVNNSKGEREFYQAGEGLYAPLSMQMYPAAFTSGTMGDQWIRKDMTVESSNPEVIRATAYRELKKNCYPAVTYEAEGFADLEIGDTVQVYDDGFSPVLLLEMRVSEQTISFTNPKNNKTTFSNPKALENKLSQGIQARLNQMLEEAKPYTIKLSTDNGVIFKNQIGQSIITPSLYKGGKPVTSGVTWRWSLDGMVTTGMTYTVRGANVTDTATLTIAAYIGNDEVAVDEISFVNVLDGTMGTPGTPGKDGRTPYVHTAWANNSTGTDGFSLDSSINKLYIGIYTDFEPADSTDPTKYKWTLIKGEKGDKGDDGVAGKDGIGIDSTVITYASSSSGTSAPTTGWGGTVPTVPAGNYLWTKTVWNYSDGTSETGYSVARIGKDGNTGADGIAGKDGVGIKTTTITYAKSTNGTTAPTSGWTTSVPIAVAGDYIWTKTVWVYTDNTTETGYSVGKIGNTGPKGDTGADGVAGKDGKGITGTVITYGISASETTQPTNWTASVPTLVKGQYLWTKTVWTYTDNTNETGYTKTYIAKDGNNGTDGIAGKDGVGISSTSITYARSTSGTSSPTSGWTSSVPTVPAGEFLWTKTVWTYTDNTNETGYSVARMGVNGAQGPQGPQGLQGLQGPKGDTGIQGPKGADGQSSYTHIAYATNSTGTAGFSISDSLNKTYIGMYVDNVELDSTDPTKYRWTLIKGADGAQGIPGAKGADGKTPYFHIAYATNSTGTTGFSITDSVGKTYIGHYSDFTQADSTDPTKYKWILVKGEKGDQGPQGIQGIQGPQGVQGIPGVKGADGKTQYTHIAYADNSTGGGFSQTDQTKAYIGMYQDFIATDSTNPASYRWTKWKGSDGAQGIPGPKGADGQTPYIHFAYSNNADGTGLTTSDNGQRYIGHYSDYTQADSLDKTKYRWADRWAKIDVSGRNLAQKTSSDWSTPYTSFDGTANNCPRLYKIIIDDLKVGDTLKSRIVLKYTGIVPTSGQTATIYLQGDGDVTGWDAGRYDNSASKIISGSGEIVFEHEFKITANHLKNQYWNWMFRTDYITSGSLQWKLAKVEKGTVFTGWSPAYEDIQADIDSKADQALTQEQLNALTEKNQILEAELQAKASMDAFSAFEKAYQAFVKSNAEGRAKSEADLIEAGRRIELLTTQFGGLAELKTFIDTYMSSSNEGLIIGKNDASSTIKVSSNRISMFSAGKEVMYISQGVINIDNGIFTVSIQIGKFRTEQYELNADMNVIRYVG